ncbi:MAG: DUF86 domain-containing protein, partial [Actinomycetota bacterium]|nr:DUF86 domain-containing protein [Actinomycetota bacterium]
MSRDIRVYLADIAERCERISRYVEGLDDIAWSTDERTQDAVLRNLEVIGEAVKRLPLGACREIACDSGGRRRSIVSKALELATSGAGRSFAARKVAIGVSSAL